MKRYLKVTSQIMPWYLKQIFVDKFKKTEEIKLPKEVGSYRYVKKLSLTGFPFGTGLYKSPEGKKVVIKIWERPQKDIYYFNLIQQIEVMKVLTAVQKRVSAKEKFGFTTPSYIASNIENDMVILVMEEVKGKSMENIKDPNKQFEIYKKCLAFLKNLSEVLTPAEKEVITTKSVWDFVFLYPFILATALIVQPELIGMLLKGVLPFLTGIIPLSKMKPNRLVHGDIHPDNIMLVDGNKFSLIDLENIRLSYAQYEPISTMALKGNSPEFKELLIKNFLNPEYKTKRKSAIELLVINNSTHNLSGDKNIDGIKSYKKAFNLAFN